MKKHASALPQSAPVLPKEWKGTVTTTGVGATNHRSPNHNDHVGKEKHVPGWNIHEEAITLTITRQEGRHLEAVMKSPRGHERWLIGAFSADGKQIQAATRGGACIFTLSGDTLSASGSGRGSDGDFDHWLNNYSATWFEFTAVK